MPAFDRYHEIVVRALVRAGWTIVSEQVLMAVEDRHLWIDIEIQHPQTQNRALVEVKTFNPTGSMIEYLNCAAGQYSLYQAIAAHLEIDTPVYMAVPINARYGIFEEEVGRIVMQRHQMRLIVFDPLNAEVVEWIT